MPRARFTTTRSASARIDSSAIVDFRRGRQAFGDPRCHRKDPSPAGSFYRRHLAEYVAASQHAGKGGHIICIEPIRKPVARLSVEDATKVFKEIDVNDNGEISQIELIKAMRSNPLLAQRMGLPTQIRQEDESRRM